MASDIKRRTEKLESRRGKRQKVKVFDYKDGDLDAQVAAYLAATPERERAPILVTLVDPTRRDD